MCKYVHVVCCTCFYLYIASSCVVGMCCTNILISMLLSYFLSFYFFALTVSLVCFFIIIILLFSIYLFFYFFVLSYFYFFLAVPGYWLSVQYLERVGRKNVQMMGFFMMGILFLLCGMFRNWFLEEGAPFSRKVLFLVLYSLTFLFR